jgi:hypothetical protein
MIRINSIGNQPDCDRAVLVKTPGIYMTWRRLDMPVLNLPETLCTHRRPCCTQALEADEDVEPLASLYDILDWKNVRYI